MRALAAAALCVLSFLMASPCVAGETPSGPSGGFVVVRGSSIYAPDGRPLLLRGINLGNWLVPEGYMFKLDSATSPRLINNLFTELLGPDEGRKFWRKFRENYIT
jgi:endoglucanase